MSRPALFPQILLEAGWVQEEKVTLTLWLWRWTLELTETRFRSPYTGKRHRLAKALRKEAQIQQNTEPLFI